MSKLSPPSPLRASHDGFGRELVNWLLPAYVLLITVGYFVFRSEAAMVRGNELSGDRALFAAVNVATLTGLQLSVGPDQFLATGQVAAFAITAMAAFFTLSISSAAVVRIVRLPYSDGRVFAWAAGACVIPVLLGLILLRGPERSAFHAAFLGLSAFANAGLHFGPLPPLQSWQTHVVLMPLAVLGGLGLPVLMDVADRIRGRRPHLSKYSRTVLSLTAVVYLVSTTVLFALQWTAPATPDWRATLAGASVASIDARTAGLGYQFATGLPRAVQWALMLVMLVGASPAGTGSGLKTTAVAALLGAVPRSLRGQVAGRSFGVAAVWAGAYLLTLLACLLALLSTDPQVPADRMLFDLVSALSNVGLSFDVLAIVGPGLYILSGAMFVGRFAPLLILWWQADTTANDGDLPVA